VKASGTPIAWPLRLWFAVEVLFGLGAILTIALHPEATAANFAWNVQPVVMAAVLGAYYVSSALLFLLPMFARRWEMIRVMILPAAAFSTAELLATLLHLSKFSLGTPPFVVWFLSYLLPPPFLATANGNDCNDADPTLAHFAVLYPDQDGAGVGAPPRQVLCIGTTPPAGLVTGGYDEDDTDPTVIETEDFDDLLDLIVLGG